MAANNWKATVIDHLLKRDSGICGICHEVMANGELFDIDHIVEKKHGGNNNMENLRAVHTSCHKLRHHPRRQIINNQIVKKAFDIGKGTLKQVSAELMTARIQYALNRNNGSVAQTARELGISGKTLYDKMIRYNIERP